MIEWINDMRDNHTIRLIEVSGFCYPLYVGVTIVVLGIGVEMTYERKA